MQILQTSKVGNQHLPTYLPTYLTGAWGVHFLAGAQHVNLRFSCG